MLVSSSSLHNGEWSYLMRGGLGWTIGSGFGVGELDARFSEDISFAVGEFMFALGGNMVG